MWRNYRGRFFYLSQSEDGGWVAHCGQWHGSGKNPFMALVTAKPLKKIVKQIVYENRKLLEELENR